MTIEGSAFHAHAPCKACDAVGPQIWLDTTNDTCFYCRRMMDLNQISVKLDDYTSSEAKEFAPVTDADRGEVADIVNELKSFEAALKKAKTTQEIGALRKRVAEGLALWSGKVHGKDWKWRVQNPDIVPTKFTAIVPTLIEAEMQQQLATANARPYISGIEFYQEEQT